MKLRLVFFVALLVLCGCTTPEQRAARAKAEVDEMLKVYGPACEKLGFKNDTDPWRDCVLRLSARDDMQRANRSPVMTQCFGHRGFMQCTNF